MGVGCYLPISCSPFSAFSAYDKALPIPHTFITTSPYLPVSAGLDISLFSFVSSQHPRRTAVTTYKTPAAFEAPEQRKRINKFTTLGTDDIVQTV
jgi:hypothetical protein